MNKCSLCGSKNYILNVQGIGLCRSCATSIAANYDKLMKGGGVHGNQKGSPGMGETSEQGKNGS